MQKLYEQHKLLTYPRTDSRFLSNDIVATLPDRLKACAIKEYRPLVNKVLASLIKANRAFVSTTAKSPSPRDHPDREELCPDRKTVGAGTQNLRLGRETIPGRIVPCP